MTSPVVDGLITRHAPRANFPRGSRAGPLFHSANDRPCTIADYPVSPPFCRHDRPRTLLRETWLSGDPRPHGMRHINLHLPLFRLRTVPLYGSLDDPVTLRTAHWTDLDDHPRLFIALSVLHDSITLVKAGSLSNFTMVSKNQIRSHAATPSDFGISIHPSISLRPRCCHGAEQSSCRSFSCYSQMPLFFLPSRRP